MKKIKLSLMFIAVAMSVCSCMENSETDKKKQIGGYWDNNEISYAGRGFAP